MFSRGTELLTRSKLSAILSGISNLKAGVIGDGCIDIYWHADMTISELSRETPHYPLPVVRELFSPGAAGNVAVNAKALGFKKVMFCSVIGKDWRGELLKQQFVKAGIDDSYIIAVENRVTPAYCKPIRCGIEGARQEDPRIDFINMEPLSREQTSEFIQMADQVAAESDVIIVTDQLRNGVVGQELRHRLQYWARRGKTILVDSRDRIGLFEGVIIKPNEVEGMKWHNPPGNDFRTGTWDDWIETGMFLARKAGAPCCMTLGAHGAIWFDDQGRYTHVPTHILEQPIDIVGAGDCFASSLVGALGTGTNGPEAIAFAHLSTAVTLKKIGTTGSASPEEIISRFDSINGKETITQEKQGEST